MNKKVNKVNQILVLAGLDPQGSAGISADILAINNAGSFALPIITNLTAQNTNQVFAINPIASDIIIKQFDAINHDSEINCIKIGLITQGNLRAIEYIFNHTKNIKIILDPIIKSSTNDDLGNIKLIKKLLKNVFLLTPNSKELELLTGETDQQKAVEKLQIPWTLITQTDTSTKIIIHKLFKNNTLIKEFEYKKLTGNYHGSGCVLSASIAGKINDLTVEMACKYGLKYTYQSLLNPLKIGKMQFTPNQIKQ